MDNFWDAITKPFKNAVQGVGDWLANNNPFTKIAAMPKEEPKAAVSSQPENNKSGENLGSAILEFGKDLLRAGPRAGASTMLSLEGQKEFVPGTGAAPTLEKFLLGDKPVKDIGGTGQETIQAFGGGEQAAKKYGLPLGFALTAADMIPIFPEKAIGKEVAKKLSEKYGPEIAASIVKKGGKKLAERALKEGGEKALEKSGINFSKNIVPAMKTANALEAIDNMMGKTGKTQNAIDWLKSVPAKFTNAFSDRFAPIKNFEENLGKLAGQPVDINSSPYVAARIYAGRMGTVGAHLSELQKILEPLGKYRTDFTRYVLSQRALERAGRGFANPGGVTQDIAKQALDELKTKIGGSLFSKFSEAEQAIQRWSDQAILKPAKETGILSEKAYGSIISKNKHWIPFQVLDYLPDSAAADRIKSGKEIFSVGRQGIIKGLEGTERAIRDPFETLVDKLASAVSLVKRNDVARKLVSLRDAIPQAADLIKPIGKDGKIPKGWGSINVFVGGKSGKWAVPEELSWALHQMNNAEAGIIGNFIKFTSSAFRKGATTLYIPFSLSNAVRDAQMATMTSKYGFNAVDWVKGFAQGLKGSFGWNSKLLDEFNLNAGGFGGFIQSSREIGGAKKALFEPSWLRRVKAVTNPVNLITNFAEAMELAPRLGVYNRALKAGASGLEAAFEARNATIDFAKSGQEMRIINMWVPFVNARWQALLNTARVFKENPVQAAAKAGSLIIAPGVTTYFWNSLNYPDLYADVPRWVKDTYFPIIVGEDKDESGNSIPRMVLIPKGDVGQIFYNPIEYALDYVRKGEPSNFIRLALEWMSQMAPVPFTRDGQLSATQFFSSALPPALRTPIELAANKSFFTDSPIVPRNMELIAPSEQYDEKTPTAAVIVGRALGISPMKLAYGLGGMLGGFGREIIDPSKILESTAQRFYRAQGGEKLNQAWNLKDEAVVGYNTARQQAKRAIEENNIQMAMAIIDKWNLQAEKILPDIIPYLAQDDPREAQKLRSSLTFQPQDIVRLQRSVYDNQMGKAESKSTPVNLNANTTQNDLRAMRSGGGTATMDQMFSGRSSQPADLRQIRSVLAR